MTFANSMNIKLLFFSILFSLYGLEVSSQEPMMLDKIAKDESVSFKNEQGHLFSNAHTQNYNILYHQLIFDINPSILGIKGMVKSYVQARENAITQIDFDCSHILEIDSIKDNQQSLTYVLDINDVLTIHLSKTLAIEDLDTISIFYHGIPSSTGFGSFQQTFHDAMPSIWTLSEPFGAKDWWPCKQQLEDKIDSLDIIINMPKGNLAGSNGKLVSIDSTSSTTTCHYHSNYPTATYLVGVAVTNYAMFTDTIKFAHDTVPIINLVYPEVLEAEKLLNVEFSNNMHLFDSLLITYPFAKEKYGHAQFGWGGGMEHQTMSFVSHLDFELGAHELAHQWFGDRITCSNWRDIWLNEGFATYMTGVSYEHTYEGKWWMTWKGNLMRNITRLPGGSVYIYEDSTSVERIFDGRLSYAKGAMLLHMLRWKFGDVLFFQALKNYLNDTSLAYQFAETANLKNQFETTTNTNLDEFFDDWFYHEGFPTYHITWKQNSTNMVNIVVRQTQSHPSVSFFEMPIPIYFKNSFMDSTIVLNNTSNNQEFNIQLPFHIDSSKFDPKLWIVSANNTIINLDEALQADNLVVKSAPNPLDKELSVEIITEHAGQARILFTDDNGRIAIDQKEALFYGYNQYKYDISTLSSGYYILYIKVNNDTYRRNFVKP